MKKGEFVIFDLDQKPLETVSGYVSSLFGIHKGENKKWRVSHLRTGAKCFDFVSLKDAKDFVSRMEMAVFPVPWESITFENLADATKNTSKTLEIFNSVFMEFENFSRFLN